MKYLQCAKCKIRYCREESFCKEELPKFCPMKYFDCEELIEKSRSESKNEKNKGKFINTILTEKEAYEMAEFFKFNFDG